jgi:hypothetical protein
MRSDILETILAEKGVGVPGQTLFTHQMPPGAKNAIMLKMPLGGFDVDNYVPGFIKGKFQVIVRNISNAGGEAKCREVIEALLHREIVDYNDERGNFAMRINSLQLDKLPIRYSSQESNTIEWSINFHVAFVLPGSF